MTTLCRAFLLLAAALLFSFSACVRAENPAGAEGPVTLVVSTYPDPAYHETAVDVTIAALKKALEPRKLHVIYADLPQLTDFIRTQKAELALLNAGHYRLIGSTGSLRDIATLLPPGFTDQNHCDGGTVVVRADSDFRSIADLKGVRLAANTRQGFNGFITQAGEIARAGFDHEHFFSSVRLTGEGTNMSDAAREVLAGRADAAFLRMCLLEHLEAAGSIPKGKLRVIEPYKDEPPLPCRRSTSLYPSWVLATTPAATSLLSHTVTKTILNLPETANGFTWGLATDFSAVDALYKTLKLGPYAYLRDWSFERLWETYRQWVLGVLLFLAALGLHHVRTVWLVNRRTRELREALLEQQRLEKEKLEAFERVNSLQKAASVSQLSSLFVHELGQPLNALVCFTEGLTNSLSQRPAPKAVTEADLCVIARITRQAQRAKDVLNRVRSYAKGKSDRSQSVNLASVIGKVVRDLHLRTVPGLSLRVNCPGGICVTGSELEIEIILMNLMKNAREAAQVQPQPSLSVSVTRQADQSVKLTVEDNGPRLDEGTVTKLAEPLFTTKEKGLGLGLSIVQSLCEAHRARLTFNRRSPSGLAVTVIFPA